MRGENFVAKALRRNSNLHEQALAGRKGWQRKRTGNRIFRNTQRANMPSLAGRRLGFRRLAWPVRRSPVRLSMPTNRLADSMFLRRSILRRSIYWIFPMALTLRSEALRDSSSSRPGNSGTFRFQSVANLMLQSADSQKWPVESRLIPLSTRKMSAFCLYAFALQDACSFPGKS